MTNYLNTGCFQYLLAADTYTGTPNSSLISAPDVPLTNLSKQCLYGLFQNQQSLLIPSLLPFTGYALKACIFMFSQCYSLTYLPEIHSLTDDMYGMFNYFYLDTRNGDSDVKNLKFMNFNCAGWGSNQFTQYYQKNRPYGIFFKTSLLPAKIATGQSTDDIIYIPKNWIIVDKS